MSEQFTLKGKYATAKVFATNIDEGTIGQIQNMINQPITENTTVSIMEDSHYGKGSTVGTTIQLAKNRELWKVSPNTVGVDIGCGMMSYKLLEKELDLETLDKIINENVPSGFNKHSKPRNRTMTESLLSTLTFNLKSDTYDTVLKSLGSLGGGNHFIEVAKDSDGHLWLTVHSGSRNLGLQVAKHHQNVAENALSTDETADIIQKYRDSGRHAEIQSALESYKNSRTTINKASAYLEGDTLQNYLNDMAIAQKYAAQNRKEMLNIIVKAAKLTVIDEFDSIHNYIDLDKGIIRKGATDASKNTRLIIPLNMRDGSIIAIGKGNPNRNFSAPHGAGRIMSRSKAKDCISFEDYKSQMSDVYTTSVVTSTLDEAPDAYKPIEDVLSTLDDTIEVLHHIKPIYNFKAH